MKMKMDRLFDGKKESKSGPAVRVDVQYRLQFEKINYIDGNESLYRGILRRHCRQRFLRGISPAEAITRPAAPSPGPCRPIPKCPISLGAVLVAAPMSMKLERSCCRKTIS